MTRKEKILFILDEIIDTLETSKHKEIYIDRIANNVLSADEVYSILMDLADKFPLYLPPILLVSPPFQTTITLSTPSPAFSSHAPHAATICSQSRINRITFEEGGLKLLKNLREKFTKNYDDEVDSNKKISNHKIKLGSEEISFNDNEALIQIGEHPVPLPPYKNEHYFCRAIFQYPAREPVDWSLIYERMGEREVSDKEKNKRMIQDTMYAVNNRVKKVINTDDELFFWREKTITRSY